MKHQGENLSFQQYGSVLFAQLFHDGNLSDTLQKVGGYIKEVNHILEHVEENIFVRKARNRINDRISKIMNFAILAMGYYEEREELAEKRKELVISRPNSYTQYMTYLFKDLLLRGDIFHSCSCLIYKLCRFHSEFCDILNQIEGKALIPQEIPE